jgi:hypothetical protein
MVRCQTWPHHCCNPAFTGKTRRSSLNHDIRHIHYEVLKLHSPHLKHGEVEKRRSYILTTIYRKKSQIQVRMVRNPNVTLYKIHVLLTILILEKLRSPSSVKFGVPSSINERSVRYMPRYGMQGGSQRCKASRKFRKRPSDETMFCSFSIVCLVWEDREKKNIYYVLVCTLCNV